MIPVHQIHPAVVHFPIVLFILFLIFSVIVVARGGSLTDRSGLANTSFWLMWAGWISGAVAAVYGGGAMAHALQAGFPGDHIAEHQGLAQLTMLTFLVLAVALSILRWRNVAMGGARGWIFSVLVLVGVGFLGETAYHGGHLVYGMGVNVDVVKPHVEPDNPPAAEEATTAPPAAEQPAAEPPAAPAQPASPPPQ